MPSTATATKPVLLTATLFVLPDKVIVSLRVGFAGSVKFTADKLVLPPMVNISLEAAWKALISAPPVRRRLFKLVRSAKDEVTKLCEISC
nr:hypothetical protein [Synechococcus lacustris]